MTIKNAINMIRNLRDCELVAVKLFSERRFGSTHSTDQIMGNTARIAQGKADYLGKILAELETVKMLRLAKKCNHPTKDHDVTSDGQKYCMNCNSDL